MSANGRLRTSELQAIPGGRLKRGGPARSWIAMEHYLRTRRGVSIRPTGSRSSYRDYPTQQAFYDAYRAGRGPLAAVPGTSNHGLGKAVDLPTEKMQAQVRSVGHKFGWGIRGGKLASDAPSEPWHCTYRRYTPSAHYWYLRAKAAERRRKRT